MLKKFYDWIDSGFRIKSIIVPAVALVVPSVFGTAELYEPLDEFIKKNPLVWCLGVIAWPIFCVYLSYDYHRTRSKGVTPKELQELLESISNIVGRKIKRFSESIPKLRGKGPGKAFSIITQPINQMEEIVEGVAKFFQVCTPSNGGKALKYRVVLAEMGNEHIKSFLVFYPFNRSPRSKVGQMQDERCGFSRAKSKKRIHIIEDFVNDNSKAGVKDFLVTDVTRAGEEGSMVCYPIIIKETGEIPYVLSVAVNQKKFFLNQDAGLYEIILEHFAERIVLEHYLLEIKRQVNKNSKDQSQ